MPKTHSLEAVRDENVRHTLQFALDEHESDEYAKCIVIGAVRNSDTCELILHCSRLSYFEALGMLQDALFQLHQERRNG